MNEDWVDELLRLDHELETLNILREHIPEERLYLVDRRERVIAAIRRICEVGCDDSEWLVCEED